MKNIVNFITGTLATMVLYYLGGWDVALQILTLIVVLDYVTGICKAIYNKELSSEVGFRGIIKKLGYFIIVAVAVVIDRIMGDTGAIRTLVIYFFVANEGLSIVENWGSMGLPLPQKLTDLLIQIRVDNDPKTK